MAKIQKRNFKDSIKYLKKEEWAKLRSSIDSYRNKLIVTLFYSTGMRRGEILNLKWPDVDFRRKIITILKTKGQKKREIRKIVVS